MYVTNVNTPAASCSLANTVLLEKSNSVTFKIDLLVVQQGF